MLPDTHTLYDVVGIGRAYTDVIANVTTSFLAKHGLTQDSGRAVEPSDLEAIQKDLAHFDLLPGGSVANTLSGIAALGGHTALFAKVANDTAGNAFMEDCAMRKIGIVGPAPVVTLGTSAKCFVLVTGDGQRSFAFNKGCADDFSASDFLGFNFATARHFLIEGHLLTSTAANVLMNTLRHVKTTSCKLVISLSDIAAWDGLVPLAAMIAAEADIIIANESEQAAFDAAIGSKAPPPETQLTITTQGAKGATARQGSTVVTTEAVRLEGLKNTVGAGDQFTAGFLYGLSRGFGLKKSMELGAQTAAAILQETGAKPSDPAAWRSLIAPV